MKSNESVRPQLRLSQIFKYAVGILTIWTEPFALARDLAGRIFMSTGKATLAHFDAHCRVALNGENEEVAPGAGVA